MNVYATMCMVPNRYPSSIECVMSLKGQVDKIFLSLNGFKEIPEELKEDWIEVIHIGENLGDAARFFKLPEIDGHLISCDDDLIYPRGYVEQFLKYNSVFPGCVLTHHGKLMRSVDESIKVVAHVMGNSPDSELVDIPGSGCSFFPHRVVSDEKFRFGDHTELNMCDIHLFSILRMMQVKIVTVPHLRGHFKYLAPPSGTTVWDTVTSKPDFREKLKLVYQYYLNV